MSVSCLFEIYDITTESSKYIKLGVTKPPDTNSCGDYHLKESTEESSEVVIAPKTNDVESSSSCDTPDTCGILDDDVRCRPTSEHGSDHATSIGGLMPLITTLKNGELLMSVILYAEAADIAGVGDLPLGMPIVCMSSGDMSIEVYCKVANIVVHARIVNGVRLEHLDITFDHSV